MPVEILILSGARQGERIELELDEFRVGDGSYCEVVFDHNADPAVRGRTAAIRRDEEGWSIRNMGRGDLMVNQEPVSGTSRLRSGDVVRMSDRGPDFAFTVDPIAPAATPVAVAAPAPTMAAPMAEAAEPSPLLSALDEASAASGPALPKLKKPRKPLPPGVIALAVVVVLMLGFWAIADRVVSTLVALSSPEAASDDVPPTAVAARTAPVESPVQKPEKHETTIAQRDAEAPSESRVPAEAPASEGPSATAPPVAPAAPAKASEIDWAGVLERLWPAVYLLVVEQPDGKFSYPFATATAIGPNTLLTNAGVAAKLRTHYEKKGYRIWAKNAALGLNLPVKAFVVHRGWTLAREPEKRIYFDVGVLEVTGKLPKQAEFASSDELQRATTGLDVACIGITHQCDAVKGDGAKEFAAMTPLATAGRVLITTRLDVAPGSPRLLHVKAPIPANVYGSPIVNREGKIVAVYSEAAATAAAKTMHIHYATLVEPDLVRIAFGPGGDKVWLSPLSTDLPEPPQKAP